MQRPACTCSRRLARALRRLPGCRHPCIVQFLGASLTSSDNVFMVTELMQCDLHAALGQHALLDQRSWRNQGILIALDIARGLSCERPSSCCEWYWRAVVAQQHGKCLSQ